MPELAIATTASGNPMGAQRYEREIVAGAKSSLDEWAVSHQTFRSLRSPLTGNRRAPMGWLATASPRERRVVGTILNPSRRQVLHRTDLILPPGAGPNVVTIHDTVAWMFADESRPIRAASSEARAADAVICVSEYTANRVADLLGVPNPTVVYNGVDAQFFGARPHSAAKLRGLGIAGRYVLHSGGASERKNLRELAAAWPLVHRNFPDVTMALLGPEHPNRTALFRHVPGTVLLGKLPNEVVPRLVAGSAAVVVPSLYEGFGLPALEAMAAGAPVVAARTSALPEVVGDAGLLVDPDAEGLRRGLSDVLSSPRGSSDLVLRGKERAREFTWKRCVNGHMRVWRSVAP